MKLKIFTLLLILSVGAQAQNHLRIHEKDSTILGVAASEMDSIIHVGSDTVVFFFRDSIFYPQDISLIDRVTVASPVDSSLYDAISSDTNFSQFKTGIDLGGLNPFPYALSGEITALAPPNDVIDFSNFSPNDNQILISYHTLNGRYRAADFEVGENIKYYTTNFPVDSVFVTKVVNPTSGAVSVYINGVSVTRADLEADNGVAHNISFFLLPPPPGNIYTQINEPNSDYDSIARLVARAAEADPSIIDILQNDVLTLLTPSNEAFATFLSASNIGSIDNLAIDKALDLLKDHMLIGRKFLNDLILATNAGSGSTTYAGATINLAPDFSGTAPTGILVYINPLAAVPLINVDVMRRNGVIQPIGGILTRP